MDGASGPEWDTGVYTDGDGHACARVHARCVSGTIGRMRWRPMVGRDGGNGGRRRSMVR